MQKVIDFMGGNIRAEVKCRYPERFINICGQNGVSFRAMVRLDNETIHLTLPMADYRKLVFLSKNGVFSIRAVKKTGVPFFWMRIRKRYVLLVGMLICLFAVWFSSLFIWEIDIAGNEKVPDYEILSSLDEIGVGIGTCRLTLSQDRISNEMLLRVPDLCWITVNTHGSRAEVLVREELPSPEIVDEYTPGLVYAKKSGIITKTTVLEGKQLLKTGDAVLAGDVIVTGEMDSLSSGTRYVHAQAEIYARTWYEMSAVMPLETCKKTYTGEEKTKTALSIGGKRINFYYNSGILWPEYDKIETVKNLTLPGDILLPFSIIQDKFVQCDYEKIPIPEQQAQRMMEEQLMERLKQKMDDGEIEKTDFSAQVTDGVMTVTMKAECVEQIGESRLMTGEEITPEPGITNEEGT